MRVLEFMHQVARSLFDTSNGARAPRLPVGLHGVRDFGHAATVLATAERRIPDQGWQSGRGRASIVVQ